MKTRVVNIKDHKDYDFYIGRLNPSINEPDSFLANHFMIADGVSRDKAINLYNKWFNAKIKRDPVFRSRVEKLKGKVLGCWCRPKPCHGDIIIHYLEGGKILGQNKLM